MTTTTDKLAATALALAVTFAAYVAAPRADLTVDRITGDGCVIVEHGPTGPEPDVTLGHTVERCADGHYRTTTWRLDTGEVAYVELHDGHVDPADRAELAERVAAIRDGHAGGRF
jgi:hypothetical protein